MRLKAMREQRGWSQAEVARRARVHRIYVVRLEAGRQDPRLSIVLRLAKALGVKPGALLD